MHTLGNPSVTTDLYAPTGAPITAVIQEPLCLWSFVEGFDADMNPVYAGETDYEIAGPLEMASGTVVVMDEGGRIWPVNLCVSVPAGTEASAELFSEIAQSPLPRNPRYEPVTLVLMRGGVEPQHLGYFENEADAALYVEAMRSGDASFSPEQLGFDPYDDAHDTVLVISTSPMGETNVYTL